MLSAARRLCAAASGRAVQVCLTWHNSYASQSTPAVWQSLIGHRSGCWQLSATHSVAGQQPGHGRSPLTVLLAACTASAAVSGDAVHCADDGEAAEEETPEQAAVGAAPSMEAQHARRTRTAKAAASLRSVATNSDYRRFITAYQVCGPRSPSLQQTCTRSSAVARLWLISARNSHVIAITR